MQRREGTDRTSAGRLCGAPVTEIRLSHAWLRDLWRAARAQSEESERDPFVLMAVFLSARTTDGWRVECGQPPLIIDRHSLAVEKIVRADEKRWRAELRFDAPPGRAIRLQRQIALARGLRVMFRELRRAMASSRH